MRLPRGLRALVEREQNSIRAAVKLAVRIAGVLPQSLKTFYRVIGSELDDVVPVQHCEQGIGRDTDFLFCRHEPPDCKV
jgi:hypothetical protein